MVHLYGTGNTTAWFVFIKERPYPVVVMVDRIDSVQHLFVAEQQCIGVHFGYKIQGAIGIIT